MKINADLIIELRKAKSWSQDELSIAAGVNLRTIQRVESEGAASLQSKKALASAFDIEVNDLDYQEKPITMKYEYKVLKFDLTSPPDEGNGYDDSHHDRSFRHRSSTESIRCGRLGTISYLRNSGKYGTDEDAACDDEKSTSLTCRPRN